MTIASTRRRQGRWRLGIESVMECRGWAAEASMDAADCGCRDDGHSTASSGPWRSRCPAQPRSLVRKRQAGCLE
jgi:hypothetical protein